MASIAELNVRIGADISALERGIRNANRALADVQRSFSQIGNQLTMSISVPLALIGAASIKTAGEFENLQLSLRATMQDAGKSIQAADAELEKLRKLAMAPGLDFPQAVKGSIVLQNVGLSAEKARNAVGQLANAIAMGGGTAENLSVVVLQFSQMIGKGHILSEDLKPIMSQMPKMAGLMKAAFGTADIELIRSKVSAQEFFDKIIEQSGKLERVQGGLANSIVNAWAAMKQAAATFGASLDKTLHIGERLNQFGDWISALSVSFSKLSEGTKGTILGIGVFVAALGPAIKLTAMAASAWISAGVGLDKWRIAMMYAKEGVVGMQIAWKGMDLAMKATVIGSIAAVVISLAVAFSALNHEMSETERVQKMVSDVSVEAEKSIAGQRVLTDQLVATLNDNNASLRDKQIALKELQAISPNYFSDLKIEKGHVEGLELAYKNYTANILNAAKAKAAQSKIEELAKENLDIQNGQGVDLSFWEKAKGYFGGGGALGVLAAEADKSKAKIEANTKAMEELAKVSFDALAATGQVAPTKISEKPEHKAKKKKEHGLGDMVLPEKIEFGTTRKELKSTVEVVSQLTNKNEKMADSFKRVAASLVGLKKPLMSAKESFSDMHDRLEVVGETGSFTEKVISKASLAFADAAASGASSFKALAAAALQGAASIVRAEILEGVAGSVRKALTGKIPFPFNLAAAAVAGGAAAALFSAAISKIATPKLAMGGLAYGPTLATVGDNVNASVNPEVIAPLDKLREMIGGSNGGGVLTTRISGNDLLILLESADQRRTRKRGF